MPGADSAVSLTAAWCTRARSPLTFPMSLVETHCGPEAARRRRRSLREEARAETGAEAAGFRYPPCSGCAVSWEGRGRRRVWPMRGGAACPSPALSPPPGTPRLPGRCGLNAGILAASL